ncbi:MAG TPA: serine/threonine-protein kinase [Bryobacteraceae bacterium]|nr:serine/threonine-protein kinase [Bryobacteraceae bacterium]
MVPERWKRIEKLFDQVCDLSPAERTRFLDALSDEELRGELRRLLENDRGTVTGADEAVRRESAQAAIDRIGPYRVTSTIGHGGMGAVYRAERADDEYRKQVAIKIVRRGLESPYAVARFRHERQILAALEHANIARLLDGGSMEDGLPYLVMEYIEGVPITQFECPLETKLQLFSQVCAAVQHAHRNLIIHRDIKPGNIIVTADGTPKLLDFGIAKLLDPDLASEVTETSTGLRMMTPQYASPEQLRGEPVTTATDIYSLGLVLREMLGTPQGELGTIIAKATHPEAQRRYGSAEQLAEDLARYQRGRPVLARPDTFGYRAGKFLKRNKAAVGAVALVIVSITAGTATTLWQARQTQERFDQVRTLANRFLFDFHDKIQYLPGSTEAREMVVRTAQEYLEKLAGQARDQQLRFELGVAYIKVGDAQGLPKQPNLGRPKDALASYQKAVAILSAVKPNASVLHEMGRAYVHIASIDHFSGDQKGEKDAITRAIAIGEHDAVIGGLAYLALGDREAADRNTSAALSAYQKSLAFHRMVYASTHSDEARRNLTVALNSLGIALTFAGDLETSLALLREGEDLRRPDANNTGDQRWMEIMYQNIGNVLGNPDGPSLERHAEALAAYRKQFAIADQLFKTDPSNSTARIDLLRANLKLAQFLAESDPREAINHISNGKALLSDLPEGLEKTFLAAALEDALEPPLRQLGRLREAQAALQRSLMFVQRMEGNTAYNASPQQAEGVLANDFGDLQMSSGQFQAALSSYELALHSAESAFKRTEGEFQANYDLSYCYERMATYCRARGDRRKAAEWERRRQELWHAWNARFIPNPYSRNQEELATRAAEK